MNRPWLWLLAQASTGNLPPSKLEQLLDGFNSNPMMGWGIAIFAVVAIAAAIAKLTGNLDSIIGFVDKYRPKPRSPLRKVRTRRVVLVVGVARGSATVSPGRSGTQHPNARLTALVMHRSGRAHTRFRGHRN